MLMHIGSSEEITLLEFNEEEEEDQQETPLAVALGEEEQNVIPKKKKDREGGGLLKAQPASPSFTHAPSFLLTDPPLFLTFFLSPSSSHGCLPLNPSSAAPNPWGDPAKRIGDVKRSKERCVFHGD